MKQDAGAYDHPIKIELPADRQELLALFEQYDFRDSLGHPLTMNLHFLTLAQEWLAAKAASCSEKL